MKVREQNIAMFGESGSGKTVLLSSWYGAQSMEPANKPGSYSVLAEDTGQGHRLQASYLGMKNQAKVPAANRFRGVDYSFMIRLKGSSDPKVASHQPFDAFRLVWHDYPGEWFNESPSSAEEGARRIDTFLKLMTSDVAVLLVDGQKLIEHRGQEERYFKSLFLGMRDLLERLRDGILEDGKPLEEFPRIWAIALSKADLHPDLTATGLQSLVIEHGAQDLEELRATLRSLVQMPEALSVGEDFLLLSSAKFQPGQIEFTQRIGLDLILPVATLLPLERTAQWAEKLEIPRAWLGKLADNSDALIAILGGGGGLAVAKIVAKLPKIGPLLATVAVPALVEMIRIASAKLQELHDEAVANHDYVKAAILEFRLALDQGVGDQHLVKSPW